MKDCNFKCNLTSIDNKNKKYSDTPIMRFNYEKDVVDLESYVANLDIYPVGYKPVSWQDQYGISWKDWNTCHYLISDMSGFSTALPQDQKLLLENSNNVQRPLLSMNLNQLMTRPGLSLSHREFLNTNSTNYINAYRTIYDLVTDRTLIAGIPIKLQTLADLVEIDKLNDKIKACTSEIDTLITAIQSHLV